MTDKAPNAGCEIAVVVMSYGVRSTLAAAVRSLLEQDVHAEIVVVHSGNGDAAAHLADAGVNVRVFQSKARLLPGGARNLGVAETSAPYVAFLADDCMAAPGWVRQRLAAHHAGAAAVSSALLCHRARHVVALAAHLCLFVRRMPATEPGVALRYGASYARTLFARHGLFRDDIESGEDTEFNQRLNAEDTPTWRPDVQTVHFGAETMGEFFSSQYGRGRRMARAWRALGAYSAAAVAQNAIERTSLIIRESLSVVERRRRATVLLAIPLIVIGSIVYAWGAWTARWGQGK